MTPLSKPQASHLAALCAGAHRRCVACSPANPGGLGLECTAMPDDSVEGTFTANEVFEGYVGQLHGGVIAALLDGAMTNCLFAHRCRAFTAELTLRHRRPVTSTDCLTVRAWVTRSRPPLHHLRAELRQGGQVRATALGLFFEPHE